MGLMDVLGGLTGSKAPKSGDPLMDALLLMLRKGGAIGSLGGLLGKFTSAGLGGQANSWVGTGYNEPLSPDDVEQALGAFEVDRIADAAGLTRDEAKNGLASMIPGLVDKVSPGGSLLTGDLGAVMKGFDFGPILSA
ncbi:YidB family protein [Ilumatobacter sp.]|uniref:YidB family protein n=1 Tax=uncultured Ilumatobacter sp. TaxID=879968 RepID=UPI00374EEAE4|nr:YidB family protein [Ilumatobacter sp.]